MSGEPLSDDARLHARIALRAFVGQQARIGVIAGHDLEVAVAELHAHSTSGTWPNPMMVTDEEHRRWFMEEGLDSIARGHYLATRLWGHIQLILSAAGNVSKALWPNPRRHKDLRSAFPDRGEELRAHFDVPADSPLADVALRNAFEHFDERIEEAVLRDGELGIYYDGMIGDLHRVGEDTAITVMRTFAKDTFTVSYLGQIYELRNLVGALQPIVARWP